MGFFSNLKNAVTGGAAEIQLQCQGAQRGQVAWVQITAQAKSSGNVSNVYLLIRAIERAEAQDTDWEDGHSHRETVRSTYTSFEHRLQVAGPFQLVEGQHYQWQAQIQLPQNVGPSFQGHIISHEWQLQAGLDMPGNDPDTGWISIQVW